VLAADDAVAVRVELTHQDPGRFNRPLVTVSVCMQQPEPGGKGCVEVPNVLLDTGSTGLLLRRSALRALDGLTPPGKYEYAYCARFANAVVWGAVERAWVGLGDRHTDAPIAIALFDWQLEGPPVGCRPRAGAGSIDAVPEGINGILGVAPLRNTCSKYADGVCPTSDDLAPYFERRPTNDDPFGFGEWAGVQPPPAFELSNPVASLPSKSNDGVVLRMDPIDATALKSGVASGTLFLGVERWTDKLFERTPDRIPLRAAPPLDAAIAMPDLALTRVRAWLDTGSADIVAPAQYDPQPQSASAVPSLQLPVFFACCGDDKPKKRSGPYFVDVAKTGSAAIDGRPPHAQATSFEGKDVLLLGMPFFYGRTIAFVLPEDPLSVSDRTPEPGYLLISGGPVE
jgi:hypothetical protein